MQRGQRAPDEHVEWESQKCVLDSVYAKYGLPPTSDSTTVPTNRSQDIYRHGPHPSSSNMQGHNLNKFFDAHGNSVFERTIEQPFPKAKSSGAAAVATGTTHLSNPNPGYTIRADVRSEATAIAGQTVDHHALNGFKLEIDGLRKEAQEKDERIEVLFAEITELRDQRETALREQKQTAQNTLDLKGENRLLKAETVRENNNADLRMQELESEKRCLQEDFAAKDSRCKHLGNLLDQAVAKNHELTAATEQERQDRIRIEEQLAAVSDEMESLRLSYDALVHVHTEALQAYAASKTALEACDPQGMHKFLPTFDGEPPPPRLDTGDQVKSGEYSDGRSFRPSSSNVASSAEPVPVPVPQHGSIPVYRPVSSRQPNAPGVPAPLHLEHTKVSNPADAPASPAGSMGTVLPYSDFNAMLGHS
jgi:hypothetical protein